MEWIVSPERGVCSCAELQVFKRGDFSICDAPRPGRPKIVTTPEIINQIHELILEDCWLDFG
jgi:hypothetical protein